MDPCVTYIVTRIVEGCQQHEVPVTHKATASSVVSPATMVTNVMRFIAPMSTVVRVVLTGVGKFIVRSVPVSIIGTQGEVVSDVVSIVLLLMIAVLTTDIAIVVAEPVGSETSVRTGVIFRTAVPVTK